MRVERSPPLAGLDPSARPGPAERSRFSRALALGLAARRHWNAFPPSLPPAVFLDSLWLIGRNGASVSRRRSEIDRFVRGEARSVEEKSGRDEEAVGGVDGRAGSHRHLWPAASDRSRRDTAELRFGRDDRDRGQRGERLPDANGGGYSGHRGGEKRSVAGNASAQVLHVLPVGAIWSGRRQKGAQLERHADVLPKNTSVQGGGSEGDQRVQRAR